MSLPADRGRPSCFGDAERRGAGTASDALPLPGYSPGVDPVLAAPATQRCQGGSILCSRKLALVGARAACPGYRALLECQRGEARGSQHGLPNLQRSHLTD